MLKQFDANIDDFYIYIRAKFNFVALFIEKIQNTYTPLD